MQVKLTCGDGAHERIDNSNLSKHLGREKIAGIWRVGSSCLGLKYKTFAALFKGLSLKPHLIDIEPRMQAKH